MKRFFFLIIFVIGSYFATSQETNNWSLDVNYFKGSIALHNDDILHLIKGQPEGFILSWNQPTFGEETWQQRYNYPDLGFSVAYQDLKNPVLGDVYSLYAHYNFYFLILSLLF